jgi:hypothetical protein
MVGGNLVLLAPTSKFPLFRLALATYFIVVFYC